MKKKSTFIDNMKVIYNNKNILNINLFAKLLKVI